MNMTLDNEDRLEQQVIRLEEQVEKLAKDSAILDSIRQEIDGEGFEDMGDLHLTIRGAIKTLRADTKRIDWLEENANFIEVGHRDIGPTRREIDAEIAEGTPT